MVILSKLRVGQYRDGDHLQDALHFTLSYWTSFSQVLSSKISASYFLKCNFEIELVLSRKDDVQVWPVQQPNISNLIH